MLGATTKNPILFISNTIDPATPIEKSVSLKLSMLRKLTPSQQLQGNAKIQRFTTPDY